MVGLVVTIDAAVTVPLKMGLPSSNGTLAGKFVTAKTPEIVLAMEANIASGTWPRLWRGESVKKSFVLPFVRTPISNQNGVPSKTGPKSREVVKSPFEMVTAVLVSIALAGDPSTFVGYKPKRRS
jgi:hypothetical protein